MKNRLCRLLLMGAVLLIAGCGARLDPFFSKHILAADRAIENARQRGVDKQNPAKFRELVKLRDNAEERYMACFYYEAKDMTREVVETASLLKGLPKVAAKKAPSKKISAVPKPVKVSAGDIFKFGVVLFDFDRYTVKPKFYPVLDRAVSSLKNVPRLQMIIEGHADSVGTLPYNQALSEQRAEEVKKYIVKKGVSRKRLSARGLGEKDPTTSNISDKGRARNRRVELRSMRGAPIGEN